MTEAQIVVVGGGIGGLSCALAFQRVGYEVRVLEQADALTEVGAGIGLWRGAIRALAELGIDEEFWQLRTCPFRWAETATPGGRVLTGFDVSRMTADAPSFVARRADLHAALARRLAPGTVTLGVHVTGVTRRADGAFVHAADGRRFEGRVVVGADGLHSVVRAAMQGPRLPRYSGETCYRALTRFAVADTGMVREVQGRGLRCAVHPLDADHAYWWAARRAPADVTESPQQRHDVLARLFAGWAFGFPEALAATDSDAILKNDLCDRPPLGRWSAGPVTLLGDAAHPTTPNLGLGGCMAIEDALVLGRAFAENERHGARDHVAAFAQYERERHRRTAGVVRMSHRYGRLGSLTGPVAVGAREAAQRVVPDRVMQEVFRRQVAYDPGPLRRQRG